MGFDQERPLGNREEGGRTALPMWIYFMEEALHTVPDHRLDPPDGLVTVRINPETGEQARAGDPGAIFEIVLAESPPPAPVTDSGLDPYTDTGEEEEDEESLF